MIPTFIVASASGPRDYTRYLGATQQDILDDLADRGKPVTARTLCEWLGRKKAVMACSLRALVARGLVEYVVLPGHGGPRGYSITGAGWEWLQKYGSEEG